MSTQHATLANATWAPERTNSLVRATLLALAGSLFIALCARIQVPMWPVPMTMQTFAILLMSLAYGPRVALATVTLYLLQGALGLPVFASGGGLAYFAGPTAGYLLSYLIVAPVIGQLGQAGWGKPAFRVFLAMLIGSFIIYAGGATWLAAFVGLERAVTFGVLPFLVGDALKAALAAMLLPAAWAIVSRFS